MYANKKFKVYDFTSKDRITKLYINVMRRKASFRNALYRIYLLKNISASQETENMYTSFKRNSIVFFKRKCK